MRRVGLSSQRRRPAQRLRWARGPVAQVAVVAALLLGAGRLMGEHRAPAAPVPLPSGRVERINFPAETPPLLPLPDGERRVVRSLINVDKPMAYGDFVWRSEDVPPGGEAWVRIDLARQLLSVFRGGHEIGTAVILYGADDLPTPTGRFVVQAKHKDYHSRSYDAPMPYMLRLTDDGVAIHGSNVREGAATHGCIGVPTAFAAHLFEVVGKGAPVTILPATTA